MFCDSFEALEWAYKQGLPKSAIIKSSSPAMLWSEKKNIQNIEDKWSTNKLKKFQKPIPKLIEDVFKIAINNNIGRELALTMAQSTSKFQDMIYYASCLDRDDFTDPRLFIYVSGKHGAYSQTMNTPWDKILVKNKMFSMESYDLLNDSWSVLTTKGVGYWSRFKVAGFETIIYRFAVNFLSLIPNWVFKKLVLLPNENELNIEIAVNLAMRGVKIKKIQKVSQLNNTEIQVKSPFPEDAIILIRERIECWVDPSVVDHVLSLFKSFMHDRIKEFEIFSSEWDETIEANWLKNKTSVLVNTPGNINGHALAYSCRKKNIPIISSQHGITQEIRNKNHILDIGFECSVADTMFTFNSKIIDIEKKSDFTKSQYHDIGMPFRLKRMKAIQKKSKFITPVLYISVNLYKRGMPVSPSTIYKNSLNEKSIVKILSNLPHKVCYKTYPEDTRRYADSDPILDYINRTNNIEIFSEKIDLRYLLSKYRILISSCATSTLGWLVMSQKPIVFINFKNNNSLSKDAHNDLSKALFVFNYNDKDFDLNIDNFLSQPIEKIEGLWQEREVMRKKMIKKYFSSNEKGAGEKAAKIILKKHFL